MEWVQDEVSMGWSGNRIKRKWDEVGKGESGYEIELVQDQANMGWSGYRRERV